MENINLITLIGFFVGTVGTGLGGVLSCFIKTTDNRFLALLLRITGGIMLSIVAFDLFPEAYKLSGAWVTLIGLVLGIGLVVLMEKILPKNNSNHFLRSGLLLGISIALHNLPEGLAVGSSFIAGNAIGQNLSIVLLLHNLPEGLAVAIPLKISKVPNWKIILITILSGAPTGVGALIGACLGQISHSFVALCLAFAGGAMLYVTLDDILPNAKALHKGRASSLFIILGFILGLMIIYI